MEEVLQKALNKEFEKYIYTLKHEIKNPVLAQIQAISHLLNKTDDNITPLQKELLTLTLDSCHKQCSIINTIIETYRFKTKSIKLNFEKINLSELIKKHIKTFSNNQIIFKNQIETVEIDANKTQLLKVLKITTKEILNKTNPTKKIHISIKENNNIITLKFIGSTNNITSKNNQLDFNSYKPIGAIAKKELSNEIVHFHKGEIREYQDKNKIIIEISLKKKQI